MEQLNAMHEIKVSYERIINKEVISDSRTAYETFKRTYSLEKCNILLKEYAMMLLLDRSNNVLGYYVLSSGGLSSTIIDVRLAFSIALKCLASGMILCHNHPSGKLKPSNSDVLLTKKFVDAGKLLDVAVLDHLIVSNEGYYSFADEGQI
jgi:DNA repair protein RadC